MGTSTTNLALYKPTAGEDAWSASVNANADRIDDLIGKTPSHPPSTNGFLAWSLDPIYTTSAKQPNAAIIFCVKIPVPISLTVTNLVVYCHVAGTNYSNAQLGLYSSAGTYLGATAVMASGGTNTFGTTGEKAIALGSPVAVTGSITAWVWAAIHIGVNSSTAAEFAATAATGPWANVGTTAATARWGYQTGHATNSLATIGNLTPASFNLTTSNPVFIGIT